MFDYVPKHGCGIIYMYTLDNGEKYIGQTKVSLLKRHKGHIYYRSDCLIDKKLRKHNYRLEIIDEVPLNELDYAETYYIKHFNTQHPHGLNITLGGGGHQGVPCSDETKRKISEANSGDKHWLRKPGAKNPNLGRIFSDEQRKRMSDAHKGQQHSAEWRQMMSKRNSGKGNPNYGRVFDDEVRSRMSASRSKIKVIQYDKETGEELMRYPSLKNAEKHTGVRNGNISKCIHGLTPSAGGFVWKKIEE